MFLIEKYIMVAKSSINSESSIFWLNINATFRLYATISFDITSIVWNWLQKHILYNNSNLDTTCFFQKALFRQIFKSNIVNPVAEQLISKLRQCGDKKN